MLCEADKRDHFGKEAIVFLELGAAAMPRGEGATCPEREVTEEITVGNLRAPRLLCRHPNSTELGMSPPM